MHQNFNDDYPADDLSLTTYDKDHQQLEMKRNNIITLP